MKVYRSRGIAPLILNLSTRWRRVVNCTSLLPKKEPCKHWMGDRAGTESVWMFWNREKPFAPAGIWTPHRSARSLVPVQTLLSRLSMCKCRETVFGYDSTPKSHLYCASQLIGYFNVNIHSSSSRLTYFSFVIWVPYLPSSDEQNNGSSCARFTFLY